MSIHLFADFVCLFVGKVFFEYLCEQFCYSICLWVDVGSVCVCLYGQVISILAYLCGYVLFGRTVRPRLLVVLLKTEKLFDGVVVDGYSVVHGTNRLPHIAFTCRM